MTVKKFLQSLKIVDLVKAYCLYENDICNYHGTGSREFHKNEFEVRNAFEKILSLEPIIDNNHIVFSIPELGTQCLDSFLIQKEELFDPNIDRIEHYGYEFCSMKEILGYQISKACRRYIDDDLMYACSILFEMTFFGYDPDSQEEETTELKEDLDQQIEDIENDTAELIDAEEVFRDFDFPIDNKTQKEIEFEDKMRSLWGNYYNDMIEELYRLERYYQNN